MQDRAQPGKSRPVAPVLLLLLAALLFSGLGIWQVKRLAWKEALIARVEQRVHAAPVAAPAGLAPESAALADREYLRVRLSGEYIPSGTALVMAVTVKGPGYWVMTPLRLSERRLVYINRGYVPAGSKLPDVRRLTPVGRVDVIGLLRLNEPKGGFLRNNDPVKDRWYSRDVGVISRVRGLSYADPYFVDAQQERISGLPPQSAPVPGLTVIDFPNSHLSYALTWFAMALLSSGTAFWLWRRAR